jgi:hypothetical protein
MAKKPKKGDALTELLSAASHKILSKLIVKLATEFPAGMFRFSKIPGLGFRGLDSTLGR